LQVVEPSGDRWQVFMSANAAHESESPPARDGKGKQVAGRLRRLVVKELREILRDRRTIITLVVMPLLIYPLLAIAFQRFLLTSLTVSEDVEYVLGVESELVRDILLKQLHAGGLELARRAGRLPVGAIGRSAGDRGESRPFAPEANDRDETPLLTFVELPAEEAARHVAGSALHLVVLHRRQPSENAVDGLQMPVKWQLVYRAGSPTSEAALHFVESRLQAYNELGLDEQLERLGVAAAMPAPTERRPIAYSGAPVFSLAALIPLILVLMTVTGAVYPAIDLTAGERERGTLETLIAAPVPRLGLLMAKYIAVLTVALLTALVNLAGMAVTAHSTGLAGSLFGGGMTLVVVMKVLLLLALFAAFFSAILLALTSYARSFKEAQAYIIPLMLLCLVPGIVCLMPGLEFSGWMAVTPLVNIVMLARDLLEGTVKSSLAAAAVCSTVFYVAAALALAARIFGTDAILYGSQATWSDLFRRPIGPQRTASLPLALFGVAAMFSSYFVLGTGLARSTELPMGQRLVVIGLVTAAVFGGIPVLMAIFGRVRFATGLGLRWPGVAATLSAAMLGVVLWPLAHEIYLISQQAGLSVLGDEQVRAARAMLEAWEELPLGLILATMALVPGIFEELAFRGFLFASLRHVLTSDRTVLVSALVFGLFHEVLTPGRFLASTFLGLVLGWVRLRSGSVVPCMVVHVIHNSLLLTVSYFAEELAARGWGVEERSHLPAGWLAAAAAGVVVASALLIASTRTAARDHRASVADS
jgi:ABC-2 type transport system permease protein/sodium transport system permease protein